MGATLNAASGMGGYTLTDRATWINFQNKSNMSIITEKNDLLLNQYGIILVNPQKCPNVKVKNATKFINWILSEKGQSFIKNFKIKNQNLFYPSKD